MTIQNAALIGLAIVVIAWLLGKFKRGGVVLAILAVLLIGAFMLVHSFQSFTGTTLAASVQATHVVSSPHTMAVSITTYDPNGNPTHAEYEVDGDRWGLYADVVSYPDWMHFIGIANSFSLSRLIGQYDDNNAHAIQPVNLQQGSAFSIPFLEKSHYRNGVLEPADGVTYNVYVTIQGDVYAVHA